MAQAPHAQDFRGRLGRSGVDARLSRNLSQTMLKISESSFYADHEMSDGLYLSTNALAARPPRQNNSTAGVGVIGADWFRSN